MFLLNRQKLLLIFLLIFYITSCSVINPYDIEIQISVNEETDFFSDEFIEIFFNYEVERLSLEDLITLKINNQVVTPTYLWESNQKVLLKPENDWKFGCNYSFTLNGNIFTLSQGNFSVSESRHFTYGNESELFYLENFPKKELITRKDSIHFTFNKAVKHSSFISGFSISPYSEYDISFTNNDKSVIVTPKSNWPINSILTWSLSKNIISSDEYTIKKEYSGDIKSVYDLSLPELLKVCPTSLNSETYIPLYELDLSKLIDNQAIYFEFSKPMDFESIEKGISFDPSIKGCFYSYGDDGKQFIYQPYTNYEINTKYHLKISDSCKDVNNIEIFKAKDFYFYSANEYLKINSIKIKSPNEPDQIELCTENEYSSVKIEQPDSLVYITFVFSEAIKNKTACENNISCLLLFPDSVNPEKQSCTWDSDFSVTFSYNNFFAKADSSCFYKITVKGTSSGVLSINNNFMEENKCVYFQTSL